MKTIGIIGGIGPESTVDYYQRVIAGWRERRPDGSYPLIVINSINLTEMVELLNRNELAELTRRLVEEVEKLARAGADFGLFSSNTPHIVFDDIARQSSIPLISIVQATCDAAQRLGLNKLGLFGSGFTMRATFYRDQFATVGIDVFAPTKDEQVFIHDRYMAELLFGAFKEETRARFLTIAERLKQQHGIDGLILGGTELPLLLREPSYFGIPFLNTTQIHVERAVGELLG
jgi:aspartate racemase